MTATLTTKKVPMQECLLRGAAQFELLEPQDPAQPTVKRQWSMVATTGKVLSRWWGDLILDLSGAQFKQRLALLMDHRTDQRLGYSTSVEKTGRCIEAKGRLLKNEMATQVLAEAAEGFPFQASLMAVPQRVQELDIGEEAQVNGKTVTGPLTIFREWVLRELTLTVLGADDETSTEAFAADGEIEVQIMTKTIEDPATKLGNGQAPPAPPTPQPAPAPQPNPEQLAEARKAGRDEDRQRCCEIMQHCSNEQRELGVQLMRDGVPLADALSKLLTDSRTRVAPPASPPLALGNASGATSNATAEAEKVKAMPEGQEKWEAEFKLPANQALRAEFGNDVSLYVAFKKNEAQINSRRAR